MSFASRYQSRLTSAPPVTLQCVLPGAFATLGFTPGEFAAEVRGVHPELGEAVVEVADAAVPGVAELVQPEGPPLSWCGLVSWGPHLVRLAAFDGPLPYGPVESCVRPALMPPEVKADAEAHRSHVLMEHLGPEADPFERYLALMAVGGALARFGATAVLNAEARTACPAFDLIPDDGEDILATLRSLPMLYLMVGLARTNVGAPERPWGRTYGAHLFGLPDLAYQARSPGEWGTVFRWCSALLAYARETGSTLAAGQVVALDDVELLLSAPPEPGGDLFVSDGELLVLAPVEPGSEVV